MNSKYVGTAKPSCHVVAPVHALTFISNFVTSADTANRYWAALKNAALKRIGNHSNPELLPIKNLAWPLTTYANAYPSWRESTAEKTVESILNLEASLFTENILTDADLFLSLVRGKQASFCSYSMGNYEDDLKRKLSMAINIVRDHWPDAFLEYESIVRGFAFVDSFQSFTSASDPKIFGLIHLDFLFYKNKSSFELATAIIHEVAHHALFIATAVDPMLVNPADPLYSPFKNQERPAIGVLHAAVALYRMLVWSEHISIFRTIDNADAQIEIKRIDEILKPKFFATLDQLASVEFTPGGKNLFANLSEHNF